MKKDIYTKITFPKLGDYTIPVKYLISHITDFEIIEPLKITKETILKASKYSPDFVCMPFKYTLGSFIEGLEKGANILVQQGGGCRYGYYNDLQEEILKELNYDFVYINLIDSGKLKINKIRKEIKKINLKINPFKLIYYFIITKSMIKYMDKLDIYIRSNIGFEEEKNSFIKLKNNMLKDFSNVKGFLDLKIKYLKYKKKFKKIKLKDQSNAYKIGLIGELYTLMEEGANYNIEYELANHNIKIVRETNVHYLLFEKKRKVKKYLKDKKYASYKLGADALDNVHRTVKYCLNKYDGIIHIKSSFCTPEISVMPIINKICKENNMPIIFFSFDMNTSDIGIKTRLEAFYDMLEMRRKL